MKNLSREQVFIIAFLFLFLLFGAGILMKENINRNMVYSSMTSNEFLLSDKENSLDGNQVDKDEEKLIVHVAGEVFFTGVHELPVGARVIDALEAAGGSTVNVNLDSINLAARLMDEEKIYIPSE